MPSINLKVGDKNKHHAAPAAAPAAGAAPANATEIPQDVHTYVHSTLISKTTVKVYYAFFPPY